MRFTTASTSGSPCCAIVGSSVVDHQLFKNNFTEILQPRRALPLDATAGSVEFGANGSPGKGQTAKAHVPSRFAPILVNVVGVHSRRNHVLDLVQEWRKGGLTRPITKFIKGDGR